MGRFTLLFVVLGAVGCVKSPAEFDLLADEVGARNEERYRAAELELRRRGYVMIEDADVLHAYVDDQNANVCIRGPLARYGAEGEPTELVFQVSGANEPPAKRIEVEAPVREACEFFSLRTPTLDVTVSGEKRQLVKVDEARMLAKGPKGEIVEIDMKVEVISRRTVLVDEHCDLMPRDKPHRLRQPPFAVGWGPVVELPVVEMRVEREKLEKECTSNVY